MELTKSVFWTSSIGADKGNCNFIGFIPAVKANKRSLSEGRRTDGQNALRIDKQINQCSCPKVWERDVGGGFMEAARAPF